MRGSMWQRRRRAFGRTSESRTTIEQPNNTARTVYPEYSVLQGSNYGPGKECSIIFPGPFLSFQKCLPRKGELEAISNSGMLITVTNWVVMGNVGGGVMKKASIPFALLRFLSPEISREESGERAV